jgi:DNA-binding NtrC family response regulator
MVARPGDGHTQTLTVGSSSSDPGSTRSFVVRVIDGPNKGAQLKLGDASLVVGAGADADLVLEDAGVSRRHLELAVVPGGVRAVDLGSKNGTRLLGAKLSVAVVGAGAEIVLGQTVLRIDDEDEAADAITAEKFGPLTSRSIEMQRAFGLLARAAPTDVAILLDGEAGVGKGALARIIHAQSPRGTKPFVEVDVASATATTIFGQGDKPGAFERAHGGTLFLDEIGALPLELQPVVARAVHSGVAVRPGDRARRLSVRVISATTRDVDGLVKAGRLRAELRDVLSVMKVAIPPLRERAADLPDLVRALLAEHGKSDVVDAGELQRLSMHRWPLNLRELKAVIARSVATSGSGALSINLEAPVAPAGLREQREVAEKDALVELLDRNGGNVSAAAREAGIDRRHLHRLLKKHGLRGHGEG